MLQAGYFAKLKIERESSFGYFLTYEDMDIMLHKKESTRDLKPGEEVEVFLYKDNEGRLSATMIKPNLSMGEFGWLTVTDVAPKMGVFLNLGINKDLLLSKDNLPDNRHVWPQPGDRVFVGMKHDKQGRLLAKLGLDVELEEWTQPAKRDLIQQEVSGYVYRVIQIGAFMFTDQKHIGFMHRDDMKSPVRLGQRITGRVKSIRPDGRLNISQHTSKLEGYSQDYQSILEELKNRGGAMPFSDQTPPDTIRQKFNISKAAFKRAMGKLMKENIVYQEEGWTYLRDRFE